MDDARLPRIDANLHKAIKMKAALAGKSMKAFVEELLKIRLEILQQDAATRRKGENKP